MLKLDWHLTNTYGIPELVVIEYCHGAGLSDTEHEKRYSVPSPLGFVDPPHRNSLELSRRPALHAVARDEFDALGQASRVLEWTNEEVRAPLPEVLL